MAHAQRKNETLVERQVLLQEQRLDGAVLIPVLIDDGRRNASVYRIGNVYRIGRAVHRHILGRRIEILQPHDGAAIDILETRIVLQHQVAVELLGFGIRTQIPTIDQRAGAPSNVIDIDITVFIAQVAVTQVAA